MTTEAQLAVDAAPERRDGAVVEVVVPVHDEEATLEASVRRLHAYLRDNLPFGWLITIADNASTDRTWAIACRLAKELDGVQALHLQEKGRGRALRTAWSVSTAKVLAYMDVDLSTELDALLPLVAPLVSGHSDVAIGTRLSPAARVVRGPRRELISRAYNLLLKAALRNGFSDAQCGFKAVRADVARRLLPMVEDQGWFFDTELLVLAERNGLRIHEVPVDWTDDPDSRVDVVRTALDDLRGVVRMVRRIACGDTVLPVDQPRATRLADEGLADQLVRFASIGVVSSVLFAVLFAVLRSSLGAAAADVVALGACAVANTAANRRLTFAAHGPRHRARQYATGLALNALPLAATLAALAALSATGVDSTAALTIGLTFVSASAALVRFVLLRRSMARRSAAPTVTLAPSRAGPDLAR